MYRTRQPSGVRRLLVIAIGLLLSTGCGDGTRTNGITTADPAPVQHTPVPTVFLPGASTSQGPFLTLTASTDETAVRALEVCIGLPAHAETLELGIFDGDGGATDDHGDAHWDQGQAPLECTLFADMHGDGSDMRQIAWYDNTGMVDGGWFEDRLPLDGPARIARAASGNYLFRLVVRLADTESTGTNRFKLRSSGSMWVDSQVIALSHDDRTADETSWNLHLFSAAHVPTLSIWDGNLGHAADTDDIDTPDAPPAFDPDAAVEGVATGTTQVQYTVTAPRKGPTFANANPSGEREWEQFRIDAGEGSFAAGMWHIGVTGVDADATARWHFDQALLGVTADGEPVPPRHAAGVTGVVFHDSADPRTGDIRTGVCGVSMHLVDGEGRFIDSATTDCNGRYRIDVSPGAYSVVIAEDSYAPTRPLFAVERNEEAAPAVVSEGGVTRVDVRIPSAPTAALSPVIWYVVADFGGGNGGNDWLFTVDISVPVPGSNQTPVGTGTGTNNIEAVAFWPGTNVLYAADANQLGTISLTTGVFSTGGRSAFGTAGGSLGVVSINDVDSLAFDPFTQVLYGAHRVSAGLDLLVQINPATGVVIADAFGTNIDYVPVQAVQVGNDDIDDIAIDATDGQMYGIANGGGFNDRLVQINKVTGAVVDVGLLGPDDMEGLSHFNDGTLWGITGNSSSVAANANSVWQINENTGAAFGQRPLATGVDFESLAFLTADTNQISGKVWNDVDADMVIDAGEPGTSGVTIELWRDFNGNGAIDGADVLLITQDTDSNGDYNFEFASFGAFVIRPDVSTYPVNNVPTTGLIQTAVFPTGGLTDANNDFGHRIPPGSIGDRVFADANGNGSDDAESGIGSVTVNLTEAGLDGTLGTLDDVAVPAETTAANGSYLFEDLPAGLYRVDVDESTLPANVVLTTANEPMDVTLGIGQDFVTADFGYTTAGSIGDRVFSDPNVNGTDDAEPGIGNVTVNLTLAGVDGLFGTLDDVTFPPQVTASDGSYLFQGLAPGLYRVDVDESTLAAGVSLSTANEPLDVTLGAAENFLAADFGYAPAGAIGDRVYFDANGNGSEDVGETGFGGVTVTLREAGVDTMLGTADDVIATPQVTAPDGSYQFTMLPPGTYRVDVTDATLPSGVTLTTANDPLDLPLAPAQVITTADFGYVGTGSIGDRVWEDTNGDGLQTGESGVSGVTVNLTEAGPDNVLGTADDVPFPAQTTGATGDYLFPGLPAGLYRVDVDESTLPPGLNLTTANEPRDVTLGAGQTVTDADFGYAAPGAIGDRVYFDANASGNEDVGETGFGGVTVTLREAGADTILGTADDVVSTPQVTAPDGSYQFTMLPPGSYRVDVTDATLPAGVTLTTANDPLDVVLTSGQVIVTADFGYVGTGSIGDRVWLDANGDGLQTGESGISGVTVNLTEAGSDMLFATPDDVAFPAQMTGATGDYLFTGLPAGLYRVDVDESTLPPGLNLTTANEPRDVTLGAGQTVTDADFGYAPPGAIGDRVYFDANGNGTEDVGETGFGGVTVTLFEAGLDTILGTADDVMSPPQVTAPDGSYQFTGLPPGSYRVDVADPTLPAGVALTTANDPLDVTLNGGQVITTADFGYVGTGSIGDFVWEDLNADAGQAGENGIPNVMLTLTEAGADMLLGTPDDVAFPPQVTDAAGGYLFSGLPAGLYRVDVNEATLPPGVVLTTANEPRDITLGAAQAVTDADFGYRHSGRIGDRVWNDLNQDGIQDMGEPNLPNVTVLLEGPGVDGVCGTTDDVALDSRMTNASGMYQFDMLPAGTYCVRVDEMTTPMSFSATTPAVQTVVLMPGQQIDTADFGYALVQYVIGSQIWRDDDEDGLYEPLAGEMPVGGVLILLRDDNGTVIDTTTTATDGTYQFTVNPGTYTVEVAPQNFGPGEPLEGLSPTAGMTTTMSSPIAGDDFTFNFGFNAVAAASPRQHCDWFRTNLGNWPLTSLTLGNQTFDQQQLLGILNDGNLLVTQLRSRGAARVAATADMTILVSWALIGAKLNVANGNTSATISAAITQTDAWLISAGGVRAGIRRGHALYDAGSLLQQQLNAFNSGK